MQDSKILIIGANGQLGKALQVKYPHARALSSASLDISNEKSLAAFDWSDIKYIINAAAYTNVDGAETQEGRVTAWKVNAQAVGYLSRISQDNDITLVHVSTEYVFDGTKDPHLESEPFSPLSTYAATKAAGDIAASTTPKHYIIRISWLIGDGKNFVRTMLDLGRKGINPSVVSDQIGRLTFTSELVRAIDHLLSTNADYGTYNVSNDGPSSSWADIARKIYQFAGLDIKVTDQSTEDYFKNKPEAAPRPLNSTLNLDKLASTGFSSRSWEEDLNAYVSKEENTDGRP